MAYSRAGSSEHIKVLVTDGEKQGFREASGDVEEGVYTDNVVWQDALLNAASSMVSHSARAAVSAGSSLDTPPVGIGDWP